MVTVLRWSSSWASRGKATVGACETYRVSRESPKNIRNGL